MPSRTARETTVTNPARPLADQELVVHVYAPTDGPHAEAAYRQIHGIWNRCRDRLGMSHPIESTGLPTELPLRSSALTSGRPAAAIEDRAVDHQAVVRREHDVVNLSLVFATPWHPSRRLRIGSASPPGWIEFDRWWDELAAGGTNALLDVVRLYQAKSADCPASSADRPAPPLDALAHQVRAALPGADHLPSWWQRGWTTADGFAVWEASPDDGPDGRRVVVIAPEDQDAELSAWTWSQGDPAMPPLGRYLMHAAKLRYQARVRGDGEQLRHLIDEANAHVTRVRTALERGAPDPAARRALRLDEADLTSAARDLRTMRRTVEIAVANMTAALATPFPADRRLRNWLVSQLGDDAEYVNTARETVREFSGLARENPLDRGPVAPAPLARQHVDRARRPGPPPPARLGRSGPIRQRMGFAVDIERYSGRTSPDKASVQERLAALTREVLDDMGHGLEETDHQATGDGMNVFLPVEAELHRALPRLLLSWHARLTADNARFRDRMRLRVAAAFGPVGLAALGFAGATIVEVARLLNSAQLRAALAGHHDADLAVLVSAQLYDYVVGEGYRGLDARRFERCLVEVKEYRGQAWLWIPQ
ncbi:BN6_48550 family protein [Streptomyces sp. PmtG]